MLQKVLKQVLSIKLHCKINDNKPSEIKALKLTTETKPNSTTECAHLVC